MRHQVRDRVTDNTSEFLRGTVDLLILSTLADAPMHGWAVSRRIRELTTDMVNLNQGSLYPTLSRLEDLGLIHASWGISDRGRRAKFYSLTAAGRRRLAKREGEWEAFAAAVANVLRGGKPLADEI